jgi:hypothetical protein
VGAQDGGRVDGGAGDLARLNREVLRVASQEKLDVLLVLLGESLLNLVPVPLFPPGQDQGAQKAELGRDAFGHPGLTADLDEGELIAAGVDAVQPVRSEGGDEAHGKCSIGSHGEPLLRFPASDSSRISVRFPSSRNLLRR